MTARKSPHHTTSRVVAQTIEVYDRDARLFLRRWGKKRYKRPALLAEWLTLLPKRAVLLDLGSGGGQDTRYLRTVGYRVVGLDRRLPLLRFGKTCAPSASLILADMQSLPICTGSLDGIWAAASLIHLPKAAAMDVFIELHRRLRPRGGVRCHADL